MWTDIALLVPSPASSSWTCFPGFRSIHLAAWEMLVQVGLLWTLSVLLPPGHDPMHVVFRADNSPSQSASWKGLLLARGMCQFLRAFNLLQEAVRVSVHLDSVPGFLNDTADALSRGTLSSGSLIPLKSMVAARSSVSCVSSSDLSSGRSVCVVGSKVSASISTSIVISESRVRGVPRQL